MDCLWILCWFASAQVGTDVSFHHLFAVHGSGCRAQVGAHSSSKAQPGRWEEKVQPSTSWSSREWIAWCVQIASITSLFIQILAELNGSVQGAHKWYTDIILSVDSGMFLHAIACYAPGPHEKHQNQCSLSKLSRHQLKESSDALAKPTPPMMGKRDA